MGCRNGHVFQVFQMRAYTAPHWYGNKFSILFMIFTIEKVVLPNISAVNRMNKYPISVAYQVVGVTILCMF